MLIIYVFSSSDFFSSVDFTEGNTKVNYYLDILQKGKWQQF